MSTPQNPPQGPEGHDGGPTTPWNPSEGSAPRDGGGWAAPTDPGRSAPGYGTPGHGIPTQGSPGPDAPGYGTPGYGTLGYGTPGYGTPAPGGPYGAGGVPPGWVPKPGIVPLRPLATGEILDGAITYIRRYPALVLGAAAVVAVVTQLVSLLVEFGAGSPTTTAQTATPTLTEMTDLLAGTATVSGATTLVSLVGTAILSGLLMVVISRAVLGAPIDAAQAWQAARPRVLGLIGVSVLSGLVLLAILIVALIPGGLLFVAGATGAGAGVVVLGVIAALVLMIWVGVSLALAAPAYVLEGIGVIEALKRSWRLVQPRFWPIFGTLLLAFLIALAIMLVVGLLFGVFAALAGGGALFDPSAGPTSAFLLVTALGSIVTMTLYAPFSAGVTGLLYVDQRMRREGFDIELQRAAGPPR